MVSLNLFPENAGNKFPREERLKSKKSIEELFNKGSSVYLYPFRISTLPGPSDTESGLPQILISIPKRNFKKSVDRNRLRRQIREIYRLNRSTFFKSENSAGPPSFMAILYTAKEKIPYSKLEQKLISVLNRF